MSDPPLPRVEVIWLDAHVSTASLSVKQASKVKPVKTYSLGYLLAENDHGLVLVSDCYPDHKKEGRIPGFIPWGMITEWRYLCDG